MQKKKKEKPLYECNLILYSLKHENCQMTIGIYNYHENSRPSNTHTLYVRLTRIIKYTLGSLSSIREEKFENLHK